MNIRPKTGEVLVQLCDRKPISPGGISLPHRSLSAEEVEQRNHAPEMPPADEAIVVRIGPWPMTCNGLAIMPEFSCGSKVLIRHTSGIELNRNPGERFKLVYQSDVLATLT